MHFPSQGCADIQYAVSGIRFSTWAGAGDNVVVYVPLGCVSKAVGQHRANAVRLENETGKRLSFREDKSLPEYKIRIETN